MTTDAKNKITTGSLLAKEWPMARVRQCLRRKDREGLVEFLKDRHEERFFWPIDTLRSAGPKDAVPTLPLLLRLKECPYATERRIGRTQRARRVRNDAEPGMPTPEVNAAPPPPNPNHVLSTVNFEDAALVEAYRRQGLTPPRRTEIAGWNAATAGPQVRQ